MDLLVDERTDDEVYLAVHSAFSRLCAAQRDLVAAVAEHDRRRAWATFGATSEEAFLVAQFDVLYRTAKEWVKVGHALADHPALGESLAAGEVSFDQLPPLIEVMALQQPPPAPAPAPDPSADPVPDPSSDPAPDPSADPSPGDPDSSPDPSADPSPGDPDPSPDAPDPSADADPDAEPTADPDADPSDPEPDAGPDPMDLLGRFTAGQLAGMARAMRRRSEREVAAAHRRRRCRTFDSDGGAGLHLDADLFDEPAALLRAAFDEYVRMLDPNPETGRFDPIEQSYADTLAEFASAWLEGRERTTNRPGLIIHADAAILAGGDGWAETPWGQLAAKTVRRMACYCNLVMCADGTDGDPLHLGRMRRDPTWQLADLVRRRDKGCTWLGCRRTQWTNCHHLTRWRDGGRTDIDNLCTLCRYHHRLVHEGGWKMYGNPNVELTFVSPTGTILTSTPAGTRGGHSGRPPDPPPADDEPLRLLL